MDIVCLSHLAWTERLFQRPHQLMVRLAARGHRVLYIGCVGVREWLDLRRRGEAAGTPGGANTLVTFRNIPFSPYTRVAVGARAMLASRMIASAFARWRRGVPRRPIVLWLYHPLLVDRWPHRVETLRIYDVMDRFEAFHKSHRDVMEAEMDLSRSADLVFAGGRSLYAAVRAMAREKVSCLPSGVDLEHFSKARHVLAKPRENPRPVLGYAGAVDERMDFSLLDEIARLRPDWSFELVGPILQRPQEIADNVRFCGPVPYAQLPEVLAGFDICLLPFRTTDLVQHISPTKTPEYLAAGKPVVSTHIPDVEADYAGVVSFARSADEFVQACEAILANPPEAETLVSAAVERARTWEQIASEMERQIVSVLSANR